MDSRLFLSLVVALLSPAPLAAQGEPASPAVVLFDSSRQEDVDEKLLYLCIENFATDDVEAVLEMGANPNALVNGITEHPVTALHLVAAKGNARLLRVLLKHGADPRLKLEDKPNTSPLVMAAIGKHYVCTKLLLEASPTGWTAEELAFPFYASVASHCEPLADLLLKHGADPYALSPDGTSVLATSIWAPRGGACLDYLLRHGFRPEKAGNAEMAAAAYLMLVDRDGCFEKLMQAGFDPNARDVEGDSLLSFAVRLGLKERVAYLLEKGADPRITDVYGRPLLSQAPEGSGIADMLREQADRLEAEGRPQLPPPPALEFSPLARAVVAGDEAAVRRLLDEGTAIDEPEPKTGNTPLMMAVHLGNEPMARLLLARGADAWAKNRNQNFPLDEAVGMEGRVGVTALSKLLWPKDLGTLTEKQILDLAGTCVSGGAAARLQQILESGVLDGQPSSRNFLLLLATLSNEVAMADMLVKAGADPSEPAIFGYRPCDYTYCRPELRELFEKAREERE